ncbi:MAG: 2-oxoglutarate dehydrogenase, E2 component, dihydrolipoamide succinyltransferase [Ignavibacteria bacterium]|nr:2-oxoglutarate dehydrogenase, E2 component, dihydrolipoamide succinyltransferase [Ignavibacteria bacterium]
MSIEVVMPKMGESIQEGKILRWVKNVGDKVERDEVILEISTDKVDTEVPSPASGVITQILFQEGDTVEVGKVICVLGDAAGASAPAAAPAAAAPAPAPAPVAPSPAPAPAAPAPSGGGVEVVMPKMGESIQEGKVLRWVKKVGDAVERDEVLLEISTDKVDTEVPSPSSGTITEILAQEGDVVEVGKVIARLSGGAAAPAAAAPTPTPAATAAPAVPALASVAAVAIGSASTSSVPRQSGSRFYSPLVRSIAAAEGISVQELDNIQGSGAEGRVTKNDIMAYLANRGTGAARPAAAAPAPAVATSAPVAVNAFPSSGVAVTGDVEVIPMDRVRQLIAEHMVRSKHTSPHVTSVAEADVTGIVRLRDKQKDAFVEREGFKLTFNPFFGFAVCEGVKAYPRINVSVDGKNIVQHRRTQLGMATALPDGNLIVPVIKGAESLNITGIARSMNDLANKARSKKLSPDDIAGGTITVTNVGSFGSLFGTPVINQPQTAIIGIGAIQKRPVVRELEGEDVIVIRNMVYISITYDHRVIDGALATQALAAMVKALESINEHSVSL